MKLIKIKKRYLIFRDEVKKIFQPLTKEIKLAPTICLDFSEVKFISRSFADELLNFLSNFKRRKIRIKILNLKPNLKKMLELVEKSKEKTKRELILACL